MRRKVKLEWRSHSNEERFLALLEMTLNVAMSFQCDLLFHVDKALGQKRKPKLGTEALRYGGQHDVHDTRLGWTDVRFERRAVRHGHVQGRDTANARLQFIEAALGDAGGDLGGNTAALVRFISDDDAMGFLDRRKNRRQVERYESARIDHFDFDAFFGQFRRGLESNVDRVRCCNQR